MFKELHLPNSIQFGFLTCTFRASCYSTHSSDQLVCLSMIVGVVALYLPTGPLKTYSGYESVPRCEPSTYQPLANDLATKPSGPV